MKICPFCSAPITAAAYVPGPGKVKAWEIINDVATDHNVTPMEMLSPSRRPSLVKARDCAARRLRDEGYLLKEIGLYLGNRNHTTIIHSLRKAV